MRLVTPYSTDTLLRMLLVDPFYDRYDAGDMTRFTFPMAFTVANLALAYLEFPDAFGSGSNVDSLMGSLKWAADWLMAARYAPDAFVAVTWAPGRTIKDSHDWWGKPEEIKQRAEVRVLKAPKPGADLLGQGAAALAAVSTVFQERDPKYSAKLLEVARGLYNQVCKQLKRGCSGRPDDQLLTVCCALRVYLLQETCCWPLCVRSCTR